MDHYNLLSSHAQANAVIKIGQLLRGDAMEAEEMEWKTFREKTVEMSWLLFKGEGSLKRQFSVTHNGCS